MPPPFQHIPIELMDILNEIKNDVSYVKERLIRLETQDHSDTISSIKAEIKEERDKRIALEIRIVELKTRLAPIMVGLSIIGAAIANTLFKALAH